MKATTWIKTIIIIALLVALYYLLGKQLASLELRLRAVEVADFDETGWGKPALRLLGTVLAAAAWTGVTSILIKPKVLAALAGVLSVIALLIGWQGNLVRSLEFLNEYLGLATFLLLVAAMLIYVISVASDIRNRISFSYASVGSRLSVLLLALAALIALVFYFGTREKVANISFAALLDSTGLEQFMLDTADRLIPIAALEDFLTEMVATISDEIGRQLDAGVGPYLIYVPPALSALLFLVLLALTIPLSWICPLIAGGMMLLLRVIAIVRVGRATTVVRRLSLEPEEAPPAPQQTPIDRPTQ